MTGFTRIFAVISGSVSALVVANAAQSLLWKSFLELSAADFSTEASSIRHDLKGAKTTLEKNTTIWNTLRLNNRIIQIAHGQVRCLGNVQHDVTGIEEVEDEKEGSDVKKHKGPSIVIGTPSELSKALHNEVRRDGPIILFDTMISNSQTIQDVAVDAISLVIVDNGQIYIGEEGSGGNAEVSAMGEVVRWMNSHENTSFARWKLLVLTSSILVSVEFM